MNRIFYIIFVTHFFLLLTSCGSASNESALTLEKRIEVPAEEPPTSEVEKSPEESGPAPIARGVFNEDYLPEALALIDSAKTEIQLAHFLFVYHGSVKEIQEALKKAVARGVRVRVLLDEESDKTVRSIPHLVQLGIDAKLDSDRKRLHTKLIVADRERAIFGSTNLSSSSIEKTNESNIYIESASLCGALGKYFDSLWADPEKDVDMKPVTAGPITIIFDRGYEDALTEITANAKKLDLQIYAARYYFDDPKSPTSIAIDRIAKRAGEEIPARAIVEKSDFSEETNEFNDDVAILLEKGGVEVRRDPISRTSHSKLAISDREVLFGSSNWGYGAFRQYHELNARIAPSPVADEFRAYFERLWDAADSGAARIIK